MKVIVCIDDNKGMLFNARRQSRDRAVIEDIMSESEKVWIHTFSEKLFEEYEDEITVDDEKLKKAGFWTVGMDGYAKITIDKLDKMEKTGFRRNLSFLRKTT